MLPFHTDPGVLDIYNNFPILLLPSFTQCAYQLLHIYTFQAVECLHIAMTKILGS